MKDMLIKIILINFLMICTGTVQAATHNFTLTNGYAMAIETSGVFSSSINPDTGAMGTNLSLNMAITTNDPNPITCMDLTACTMDSLGVEVCSMKSDEAAVGAPSTHAAVVFGNDTDITLCPTDAAIADCCGGAPSCDLNPDAISYRGLLTINNGGSLTYSTVGNNHFDITVQPSDDPTIINYTLECPCCAGTYDDPDGEVYDVAGTYEVEICLTGIPSI